MNKKLIREKGYTVVIVSWENDADHYRTKSFKANSKEEALEIKDICDTLFVSHHQTEKGISNDCKDELSDKDKEIILEFMEQSPELMKRFSDDGDEELDNNNIIDAFQHLAYELMGGSEWYTFRVCESCNIEYTAEDIFVENIN